MVFCVVHNKNASEASINDASNIVVSKLACHGCLFGHRVNSCGRISEHRSDALIEIRVSGRPKKNGANSATTLCNVYCLRQPDSDLRTINCTGSNKTHEPCMYPAYYVQMDDLELLGSMPYPKAKDNPEAKSVSRANLDSMLVERRQSQNMTSPQQQAIQNGQMMAPVQPQQQAIQSGQMMAPAQSHQQPAQDVQMMVPTYSDQQPTQDDQSMMPSFPLLQTVQNGQMVLPTNPQQQAAQNGQVAMPIAHSLRADGYISPEEQLVRWYRATHRLAPVVVEQPAQYQAIQLPEDHMMLGVNSELEQPMQYPDIQLPENYMTLVVNPEVEQHTLYPDIQLPEGYMMLGVNSEVDQPTQYQDILIPEEHMMLGVNPEVEQPTQYPDIQTSEDYTMLGVNPEWEAYWNQSGVVAAEENQPAEDPQLISADVTFDEHLDPLLRDYQPTERYLLPRTDIVARELLSNEWFEYTFGGEDLLLG